jgi:Ca-activated chloride channel family protein
VSAARFAHPEWLLPLLLTGLAAGAALLLAQLWAGRRRRILLGAGGSPAGAALADVALLVALCCIAVALLGPRLGERRLSLPASGVDVVLLVDVSRSMDARDVPPSRLDRARRAAEEMLARLEPQDRAALAAFAGRGVLLAPLTPDRDALAELISALDTELIRPRGSDLGDGLRAALSAFEMASERPRVVVVLSDGEDPEQGRDLGSAAALRAEARVIAAALGSDAGATIPDHGVALQVGGTTVITRRRAERLGRLTAATGGELFRADRWGEFDFDAAAAALRRDAGALPGVRVERRVPAVRVLPFAALAFALLLLEWLPWSRPRTAGALATLPVLLFLIAAAPPQGRDGDALEGRLRASPRDARLLVELGLARLERGEREAAARAFLEAAIYAREPQVASLAYYDLGVTALERGDLETARDGFFDALALDPGDRQARFNLEWTLQALTLHPPPPPSARRESGADDAEAAPESERDARRESAAAGEPDRTDERPAALPRLSDEERRRWLDRVEDDPVRSLRAAAGRGASGSRGARRPSGPAW